MQLLYVADSSGDEKILKNPVAELEKKVNDSRALFVYLLYYTTQIAQYAEIDAKQRASKNLPTYEDLHVNTFIAGNSLLWQILENTSYREAVEKDKPQHSADKELIRKIYQQLTETEEYKKYIKQTVRDKKEDKEMIAFIFNALLLPNENFQEHVEEVFTNWDDDGEMMQTIINSFFDKPKQNIARIITEDKWDFAKALITTAIEKNDYVLSIIKPKLKNWDSERIAALDMIIMKMGICELLYFETIPTKVSINEYIDLAKEYSTPQSGQFVNGILDNIHKELLTAGKINKIDFRKKA